MIKKDVAKKLSLLPEGLPEKNLRTWQASVKDYEKLALGTGQLRYQYLLDTTQNILGLEDAKLINSFPDLWMLIISTQLSLGEGLGERIPFTVVGINDEISTTAGYYTHSEY